MEWAEVAAGWVAGPGATPGAGSPAPKMPFTKHGERMRARFRQEYGAKVGERIFYATAVSPGSGGRGKIGGKNIERGGGVSTRGRAQTRRPRRRRSR